MQDDSLTAPAYLEALQDLSEKVIWAAARTAGLELELKPASLRKEGLDLGSVQYLLDEACDDIGQAVRRVEIMLGVEDGVHLDARPSLSIVEGSPPLDDA